MSNTNAFCLTADTHPISEPLWFDRNNRGCTKFTKQEFLRVIKYLNLNCSELNAIFPLIITKSVDQGASLEANNSSANHEIPRTLWYLNIPCLSYNRPLVMSTSSQRGLVCITVHSLVCSKLSFSKIHCGK